MAKTNIKKEVQKRQKELRKELEHYFLQTALNKPNKQAVLRGIKEFICG